MKNVRKSDGSTFVPPAQCGRGRKAHFPFRYLEVGDSFRAHPAEQPTLKQTIRNGRIFGRDHTITLEPDQIYVRVTRVA